MQEKIYTLKAHGRSQHSLVLVSMGLVVATNTSKNDQGLAAYVCTTKLIHVDRKETLDLGDDRKTRPLRYL